MFLWRKLFSSAEEQEDVPPDADDPKDTDGNDSPNKQDTSSAAHNNSPSMAMRVMIASFRKKFPTIKGVTTEVVQKWFQQGAASTNLLTGDVDSTNKRTLVIVDSRPEAEYRVSHIPGAVRIEFSTEDNNYIIKEIQTNVKEEGKKLPKTIVMYCSLGYRSSILADKLQKAIQSKDDDNHDFEGAEIYNMEGGIFKWANEGSPMVDVTGSSTKYAHPFNAVFGKLLHYSKRKEKL
ncbi:uncharacterized protein LOC144449550 [Glandiceps talaboti]